MPSLHQVYKLAIFLSFPIIPVLFPSFYLYHHLGIITPISSLVGTDIHLSTSYLFRKQGLINKEKIHCYHTIVRLRPYYYRHYLITTYLNQTLFIFFFFCLGIYLGKFGTWQIEGKIFFRQGSLIKLSKLDCLSTEGFPLAWSSLLLPIWKTVQLFRSVLRLGPTPFYPLCLFLHILTINVSCNF